MTVTVDDPSLLDPQAEFIRVTIVMFTSRATSVPAAIDSIEIRRIVKDSA